MRFFILLVIFWGAINCTIGQTILDTMIFDNTARFYRLYIPENVQDQDNLPLVFNLHGRGSSGLQQQVYSAMDQVADTAGFIICYPDGIDEIWNSGFDPDGVDDAGFIEALIDEIYLNYTINLDKVYACGMSNGGYQSLYMACEKTHLFAAVASVTGSMTKPVLNNCEPSSTIPVMQIHGTDDDTVLYDGSDITSPIEEVVQFWVAHNECNSIGDTVQIENIDTTDSSTAERILYTNGVNNSEVIFYKITNGGHTWPGSSKAVNELFELGVVNLDFNSSAVIWNFFNQYALSDSLPLSNGSLPFAEPDVDIFPNPFNRFVYISAHHPFQEVELLNLNGQLLHKAPLLQGERMAKVELNHLTIGIYLLKLISKDFIYWHKIVKNE